MSNKTVDRIEFARSGFEFYVDKYMELFCEKQEMHYDKENWTGFGEIIEVGDMNAFFSDIRMDVDLNVTKGVFVEWYWTVTEKRPYINYNTWLMGLGYKKLKSK